MDNRGRRKERLWTHVAARMFPVATTEGVAEVAINVDLWETDKRAYARAELSDGTLVSEFSAGDYYLREHDHDARHQVLRTGFGLERSLAVVRGSVPTRPEGTGGPDAADAVQGEAIGVTVEYPLPAIARTIGPSISRPKGFSWELYAHRELEYVAAVCGVALPPSPRGSRLEAAFLYGSSWLPVLRAHVVWDFGRLGELELVVMEGNADPEALPSDDVIWRAGALRSACVRGTQQALMALNADSELLLDQIVQLAEPMPTCEMPSGRIVRRGALTA